LLLLGAVFAVHGVQCTAVADGGAHTPTPVAVAGGATSPTAGHVHLTVAVLATTLTDPVGGVQTDGIAHVGRSGTAVGATSVPDGHGGAPDDTAGHLWTVCLAVLAAGLAVLLAVLAPRLALLTAAVLTHARARLWSLAPRPPDLAALCLLRI
jgi:hypothetical protein